MLKDQLIAFAALLPFLTAPIIAPKPAVDAKTGKPATAVSNEPPLGANSGSVAAKADDKKPPLTKSPDPKVESKKPEDKTSTGKPVDPKSEVKKPEDKKTSGIETKKPEDKSSTGKPTDPKSDSKKPESKKPDEKTVPVKPIDPKTEVKKPDEKKPPITEGKKPEEKTTTAKPVDPKTEVKTPPVEKPKPDEAKPAESKQQGTGELLKVQSLPNFEEVAIGTGLKLSPAERAVIHFVVADSSGRELVNSRKRGLPFTIEAKPDGTELWDFLLKDMKVGGCRKITLLPAQVNEGKGLSPYIPSGIQVSVAVWLLRSIR